MISSCGLVVLIIAVLFFVWILMYGKCCDKKEQPPSVGDVDFGYDQDAKQWKFTWPVPQIGCGTGYVCSYIYALRDPNGGVTSNINGPPLLQNSLPLPTPVIPGTYTIQLRTRNQIGTSAPTVATGVVTAPVELTLQVLPLSQGQIGVSATYPSSAGVTDLKMSATTETLGPNGQLGAQIPLPLTSGSATAVAPTACQQASGNSRCVWTFGYGQNVPQTLGTVDASKVLRGWNTITYSVSYVSQGTTKTVTTTEQIAGVAGQQIPQSAISLSYL
ncbi:putative membrane protein [Golden Marseillevirus]|uniref:hypothetical protein n=1 Tax=Golden Marseillevirus TaxID=1720526 RepID=UPI000877A9E4|nr:hypothetical protein GMAR_ORF179 [Golden Marseillevirus]ALX27553.1 putative membrane protein [Golden Marseillevirus]